jgi:uncharacterized RDD family membrane protein YckC
MPGPAAFAGANPSLRTGIEREFAERQQLESRLDSQAGVWRDEVASRVENYRSRRSRKRLAGEFSMRLDFGKPHSTPAAPSASGFTAAEPALSASAPANRMAVAESLPLPEAQPAPPPMVQPAPPREVRIIEFPRLLVFPEFAESDPNELAEPVLDKPRILDVPEVVGSTPPPLADIALQSRDDEEEPAPPTFELPLRVAPLPQRFTAALIDMLIVAVATAVFAMTVAQFVTDLVWTKPLMGLAAMVPVLFWAVFNYLFLVHGGATPGMLYTRIRLSAFTGNHAPRPLRRWRALLMVLSGASIGFGFLWALFDQDTLCWHDRMTRTYLILEG